MIISTTNRVDDASTLSVDSEVSTLPIENVQDRQITKVYRSDSATTIQIDIDFGSTQLIDFFAIIRHNITVTGTVRYRYSTVSDFSTTVRDTTAVNAWPVIEPFGSRPWGVFSWGGFPGQSELEEYTVSSYDIPSESVFARYIRIDIVDDDNSDGYIEIGRIVSGPAYRPSNNYSFGSSIEFVDNSRVTKSRGGQTFIDEVEHFRVFNFQLINIPEAEIFSNIFNELDRLRGIGKDILIIPQPGDETTFLTQNIYGRLQQTRPIQNRVLEYYGREFNVEELI